MPAPNTNMSNSYKLVTKEDGKFGYKVINDAGDSLGVADESFDNEQEAQAFIDSLNAANGHEVEKAPEDENVSPEGHAPAGELDEGSAPEEDEVVSPEGSEVTTQRDFDPAETGSDTMSPESASE